MTATSDRLNVELVEQILIKLGFSKRPEIDLNGLTRLYGAWCQGVPFDNIRKRIHLTSNNPAPLPGHDDADFFQGWLQYGLGGLCWAGNAALHALLEAVGFSCKLGSATMLIDALQPPNHGTVSVELNNRQYLVDASMLHNTPLPITLGQASGVDHPSWGLTCSPHNQSWNIRWRPLHMADGCNCRIENLAASRKTFRQYNEITRSQSPFNDALYLRMNTENEVIGITGDSLITFTDSGEYLTSPLTAQNRLKILVEKMGIKEEFCVQIPPDR